MKLSAGDIARIVGGELVSGSTDTSVTSFGIDTRELEPGALFIALVAERDGHDFLDAAAAARANLALVQRAVVGAPSALGLIRVADTASALSVLGREARRRLAAMPVVAITGSTGKTSTKDLLAAAARSAFGVHGDQSDTQVVASRASFNNELGVPLTLLRTDASTRALILEMGARGPGQIAELCRIAQPTVGVITNIGLAHVELFKDRPGIAKAKGELFAALPSSGTAVINADCDMKTRLFRRSNAAVITFGEGPGSDVRARRVELDSELRARFSVETPWGRGEVQLGVAGRHQVANACAALAAGGALRWSLPAMCEGLRARAASPWRMDLRRSANGVRIVNDAYNANPTSMAAALRSLAGLPIDGAGHRWAVLGRMAELGTYAATEHANIGSLVAELGLDGLVAVGEGMSECASAARAAGMATVFEVSDVEGAIEIIERSIGPDDAVLVKASRVVGLERIALQLLAEPPTTIGAPS